MIWISTIRVMQILILEVYLGRRIIIGFIIILNSRMSLEEDDNSNESFH